MMASGFIVENLATANSVHVDLGLGLCFIAFAASMNVRGSNILLKDNSLCLSFSHRWHQGHRVGADQDVHETPQHRGQTQRVFYVSGATLSALEQRFTRFVSPCCGVCRHLLGGEKLK